VGYSTRPRAESELSSDWRIPNIVELQTIVDLGAPGCGTGTPCIDPIFGPTASDGYWSSSTYASGYGYAWGVFFEFGVLGSVYKNADTYVRAARGGL
jgi:hypothetical protein